MKNLYYIDTHVHLNDEKIKAHLDEVINEALANKVEKMFVVGWDKESSIEAIKLSETYDFCYAIIGFHPCNIKGYGEAEFNWLDQALTHPKVVALGEIGYDFHWDTTTEDEQTPAFIKQLDLAVKHQKPVSIHSRDAAQITFDVLKKYSDKLVGGVLHSYSGSVELAKEYIKLNFMFGISGPLTFKNAKTNKEVVAAIDLKHFISETDSPYLTPHPYRGTENGPKYIPLILKEIASIKNLDESICQEEIIKNVKRVFGV
jgi:TatD DNase family protein